MLNYDSFKILLQLAVCFRLVRKLTKKNKYVNAILLLLQFLIVWVQYFKKSVYMCARVRGGKDASCRN